MNRQDLQITTKKESDAPQPAANPMMFPFDPIAYQQYYQQYYQQQNGQGFPNNYPFLPHPGMFQNNQFYNMDPSRPFSMYSDTFQHGFGHPQGDQFFSGQSMETTIQMNQLKPTSGIQACELYQRQFAPQLQMKHGKECLSKKKKTLSNPKRNTIKNLGNQIISFICSKKSYEIIQRIQNISLTEDEFICFKEYCHKFKNNMLKIADLRNVWIGMSQEPKFVKYHKLIRIMSRYYLNNEAVIKILTSNKLKDRRIHLQIRRTLLEKLKDPESFKALD